MNGKQESWGNFASFYWCFIQSFNKLAKPLTLMLKTTPTQLAQNSPLDMAEDAEVESGTSSTTRLAKNFLASKTWLRMVRLARGMVVMMKQSKDHLLRSWADLQDILPLYTPEKDEFSLIVLAMIEAFS